MRKKIFITIGIVFGVIVAFAGAVFGILAAMGKFKQPTIRPEQIYFENEEQVIIADYLDDDGNTVLYSFELKGVNENYEYPVNKPVCYIWFKNGVGADLIELCDAEGNPLVQQQNLRYEINCNEKIYYKLKEIDTNVSLNPESEINGKVVITAMAEDKLHYSTNELTIWIDRRVDSVFLDYGDIPVAKDDVVAQEQQINVGVEIPFDFEYVVNPEISLNPISKESKKIVELYYDPGDDYVLVDKESIKPENSRVLSELISYDEQTDTYAFKASKTGKHNFIIAVFPTYQAKYDYENSEYAGVESNVLKLSRGMVLTNLTVNVVNTNVDSVSMSEEALRLNLYSENDYMSVVGASGVEGANDNNLQVIMKKDNQDFDLRLDEITVGGITADRYFGSPKFVLEHTQSGVLSDIDFKDATISYSPSQELITINGVSYKVDTNIVIDGYKLINCLTNVANEGLQYYCNNGAALINDSGEVRLLNNGSYLDFYIRNEFGVYTMATEDKFAYSATKVDAEYNTWQILTKGLPNREDGETLELAILVVNNDGKFIVENFFKTKEVVINLMDINPEVVKDEEILDITVEGTEYKIGDPIAFEDFVKVGEGSYNAGVFVISSKDLETNPSLVSYINMYFIKDEIKYYIVGYIEDGAFVNKIKANNNENATIDSKNVLYFLQLKNGYNNEEQRQQTAEEFITELIDLRGGLATGIELNNADYKELRNGIRVTIKQNLLIDVEKIIKDSTFVIEPELNIVTNFYEGTLGHKLHVYSKVSGLIERLIIFYNITEASKLNDYFTTNYPDNVIINSARPTEIDISGTVYKRITIEFDLGKTILDNPDVTMSMKGMFVNRNDQTNNSWTLKTFKILSSAPEVIVYKAADNKEYELSNSTDTNAPIIKVTITWNNTTQSYVYNWKIAKSDLSEESEFAPALNSMFDTTSLGFRDKNYKINQNVAYAVYGSAIKIDGTNLEVVKPETEGNNTYLAVTIAGQTRYVKVEIVVDGFTLAEETRTITGVEGYLSDLISYQYAGSEIEDLAGTVELSNFDITYANQIEIEPLDNDSDGNVDKFLFKEGTSNVLVIEKNGNDWKFTREYNVFAALVLNFTITTKTKVMNFMLNFDQAILHDYNISSWTSDYTLFADTTILVYEISTTSVFENQSLLRIINKNASNISVEASSGNISTDGQLKIDGSWDIIEFKIYSDLNMLYAYSFKVVPNLVVRQSTSTDLIVDSGSNNVEVFGSDDGLVALYEYANTFVYGSSKLSGGDKFALYTSTSNEVLIDKTDDFKSYMVIESEGTKISKNNGESAKTTWITNIGSAIETEATVKYNGIEIGKFNVIIKNNNKVKSSNTNAVLNIQALENIAGLFTINGLADFKLQSIKWEYSDADNNSESELYTLSEGVLIIPAINKEYNNVILTLTFTNGNNTLIYTGNNINGNNVTINILPYELDPVSVQAYSNNSFNILTDVYNITDIENYITAINVLSVKGESANSLTSTTLGVVNLETGLNVLFNKINSDEITAYITYEVTYIGNVKYTYTKEISLKNWQEIVRTYPEQSDNLKLTDNVVYLDGNVLKPEQNIPYDTALVNVNAGTTIDLLAYDDVKHVTRFTAVDRSDSNKSVDLVLDKLEIIGYQNTIGMLAYINRGVSVSGSIITLPSSSSINGVIVFRLTSTSGNFMDYYLHVYGTNNTAIKVEENATLIIGKDAWNNEKIEELVSSSVNNLLNKDNQRFNFKDIYGMNYSAEYIDIFLLDATSLNDNHANYVGDAAVAGSNRYNQVDDKSVNVTSYLTLTLDLIYRYGPEIYSIGTLKLCLNPEETRNFEAYEKVLGNYTKLVSEGNGNGEYNVILNANATEITNPFVGFKIDTESFKEIYPINSTLLEINDGVVTIKQKVTTNCEFTLFYLNNNGREENKTDDVYLKVVYTYPAVTIPQATYKPIGEFKNDKFNDIVTIDSNYFGSYYGSVTIEETTFNVVADGKVSDEDTTIDKELKEDVSYSISSGVLTFKFNQGVKAEEVKLSFVFDNLIDENKTITHKFLVQAGIQINEISSDNSGLVQASRLPTVNKKDYTQATGSTISIKKENIEDADHNIIAVKYVLGGYEVYIKNGGSLDLLFETSNAKYVTSNISELTNINSNKDIGFVHYAGNGGYDITAKIKIKNSGSNYFKVDETHDIERNLYIKICQTYVELQAEYYTADASFENVKKGQSIFNLTNRLTSNVTEITDLFGNTITNPARLKVKTVLTDGDDKTVYIYNNFAAMGFNEYGNPNYLDYEVQEGKATISTNANKYNIAFASDVASNEVCTIYMYNSAGMTYKPYNFQIMADTVNDGITFSDKGYVDEANKYMSFVVNRDEDTASAYETGDLHIGTLKDGNNQQVYLTSVKINEAEVSNDINSIEWFDLYNSTSSMFIIKNSTSFEIRITVKDLKIYANVIRKGDAPFGNYKITLTLHGSTGYILEDFNIILFNKTVEPAILGRDTSVYGGQEIAIKDVLNVPDDALLSVDWVNSKYGTQALNNSLGSENNELIKFDSETNVITTKTVGQTVLIDLVFKVQVLLVDVPEGEDTYAYVKSVTYQLALNRSVQFFVNGEEPKEEKFEPNEVYDYSTNFVLTNNNVNNNFDKKITHNFASELLSYDADRGYYKSLVWKVYDRESPESVFRVQIVKNEAKANPSDDILTVSNAGIKFAKDYTGKVNLLVTLILTNGFNYSVNWEINVLGMLQFTASQKLNDGVILNNGVEFESGSQVDFVNKGSTTASTAVQLDVQNNYFTDNIKVGTLKFVNSDYVVMPYNQHDGLTNQQRYESVATKDDVSGDIEGEITANKFSINLPIVVADTKNYIVIYKLQFNYLGYTTEEYYCAYVVKNNLNISANKATVNVNNRMVNSAGTKSNSSADTYLDLFYYSENYQIETTTYSFIYDDGEGKYVLIVNGVRYEYDGTKYINGNNYYTVTRLPLKDQCEFSYYKDYTLTSTITADSVDDTTNYLNNGGTADDETDDITSVFNVSFNTIEKYKAFINSVKTININNNGFTLKHLANGRFGINLAEHGKLFNNELATDISIKSGGKVIYTLAAYDENNFKSGFMLTTNTVIKAYDSKKLSNFFLTQDVVDKESYNLIKDYNIIGIYKKGDNLTGLVSGVSGLSYLVDSNKPSIQVSYGSGVVKYQLHKVTFCAGGGGAVYSVEKDFYVIYANATGGKVYKADYSPVAIEPLTKDSTDVDLSTVIRVYSTNSTKITLESFDYTQWNVTKTYGGVDAVYDKNNGVISVAESELIKYKNANPNSSYVTVEYLATFDNNINVKFALNYQLPSTYSVIADGSASETIIDLENNTIISGTAIGGTNVNSILSITEIGSDFTLEYGKADLKYTGKIKLDKNKISTWFRENPTKDRLEISYKITIGETDYDFVIRVNK